MTDTIKYSLGALGLIFILFLYNRSSQSSFKMESHAIYDGSNEDIYRIKLSENDKEIELIRNDSTWSISQVDSLIVKDENDNEILHYLFGNSGQDWQHNYTRKNGSPDVYRTNDNVYFLLNTNTTYWGKKPPDPKPPVDLDSTVINND